MIICTCIRLIISFFFLFLGTLNACTSNRTRVQTFSTLTPIPNPSHRPFPDQHHQHQPLPDHHQLPPKKKPRRRVLDASFGLQVYFFKYIYNYLPTSSQHTPHTPSATPKEAQTTCLDASFGLQVCFFLNTYILSYLRHHRTTPHSICHPEKAQTTRLDALIR